MIEKILANLRETKPIINAAQSLINENFDGAAEKILGAPKKRGSSKKRMDDFKKAIQESNLITAKEKAEFNNLCDKKVYKKAREIILELIKKEIKH